MRRVRKILTGIGYCVLAALLIWVAVGSVIGWFIDLPGARRQPREGEPCGPGYRWTRVGSPTDLDLSCERE